jgi:hypothetical protein
MPRIYDDYGKHDYSRDTHAAAAASRRATGTPDFAHTATAAATGRWVVHPDLDVSGSQIRESRDSAKSRTSYPIVLGLDLTGSNMEVAKGLLPKVPTFMGVMQRSGYVQDPQIMIFGFCDATADDSVPVQVSQFEVDNLIDENIRKLALEPACGGNGIEESSELLLWYLANRVRTDAWDKRSQKGVLVLVTDEKAYPMVRADQIRRYFGDTGEHMTGNVPLDEVLAAVLERWEVRVIIGSAASHAGDKKVLKFWQDKVGPQNVTELADLGALAEMTALMVGITLGTVTPEEGLADLTRAGVDDGTRATVGNALATLGGGAGSGGLVAAAPPGPLDTPSGSDRL